ncbi:MAG: adenylate kinase [Dysgonamonadaceae bacterium]|jgi:adenylate kinase|nr:adenylate kinase [Dysgonamonadaceae bacterium]
MLNIVIFGAPGSGKGTQSKLIIEKYGLHHISTGDILRQEIEQKTALGLIAEEYIAQGHLVPDQLIIDMMADILDRYPSAKGYIFDGFPRTLSQGEALDTMLSERNLAITAVLRLQVNEKLLIDRMLKRKEELGRSDDNLETIQNRLHVYKTQTDSLSEYYKKKGKLFKVEGDGLVDDVFEHITEVINLLSV